MKCIYCKKDIQVVQGYIVTHPYRGGTCPGSGDSPTKMSRDAEFLDMMRQLKAPEKKSK